MKKSLSDEVLHFNFSRSSLLKITFINTFYIT